MAAGGLLGLLVAELFEAHRLSNFVLSNCVTTVQTQIVNSLEGSLVFRLVVGGRSELQELRRLDRDLRRQRTLQLQSTEISA